MSKFINRQVEVKVNPQENPVSFKPDEQWIFVNHILELWKDTGTWWDGESEKTFFRLEAGQGGLYELYRDNISHVWYLYRIYD